MHLYDKKILIYHDQTSLLLSFAKQTKHGILYVQ